MSFFTPNTLQEDLSEEEILDRVMLDELFASDSEDSDDLAGIEFPKVRNVTAQYSKEDRLNSVFWKKYIQPAEDEGEDSALYDPEAREGILFRRRFRVPYDMFQFLVEDIRREFNLPMEKVKACGTPGVDVRLLVLGSLRAIASGCPFDLIEELTNVSEEAHRRFFHDRFCKWGDIVSFDYIKMPSDPESFTRVAREYEERGLPGCAASVDCVHLVWDRCPAGLKNTCQNGKEKYPTLVFEVAGSHSRRIMHVSQYFWGTINDKTISRLDKLFGLFRDEGSFLKSCRWTR